MNMNEPDELAIFRGWFPSFMKPFQSMTIEKSKDEFENFFNHLVQILVQKVIRHQKKPITIGFFLYHLMPIAGIEPVTYALRVRCSTN